MKGIKIIVLLLFSVLCVFAAEKRYQIESGIIEYEIDTQGTNMGISSSIKGTGTLLFKDFGNLEVEKESFVESIMGQEQKSEEMSKYDNGIVYSVDYEDNIIYKQDISKLLEEQAYSLMGEKGLEKMGAKKTGSETILGYNCDIWELQDLQISLYKGVPLKIKTEMMDIKQIQIAKKVQFDVSIPDKSFNLPDYPIKNMEDMLDEKGLEMDAEEISPEQKEMFEQMMQNMQNMKKLYDK